MYEPTTDEPTMPPISPEWSEWWKRYSRALDHAQSLGRVFQSVARLRRSGAVKDDTYTDALDNYNRANNTLLSLHDVEPPMFGRGPGDS